MISSKFSHFYASDEDEKIEDSRKAGFEFVFKSGFFRNNRDKTEVSFLFFRSKARMPSLHNALSLCFYSNSMVATGFSLMSQRTRLTPGTVLMIRSRMVQSTEKGISGTVAVTASTVLTARTITAQPM